MLLTVTWPVRQQEYRPNIHRQVVNKAHATISECPRLSHYAFQVLPNGHWPRFASAKINRHNKKNPLLLPPGSFER